MSEVGDIYGALSRGRDSIASFAATAARAQTGTGVSVGAEAAAADAARAGVFMEAMLAAAKSRFTEYKTVTQK